MDNNNSDDDDITDSPPSQPMRLFSLHNTTGSIKRGLTTEIVDELKRNKEYFDEFDDDYDDDDDDFPEDSIITNDSIDSDTDDYEEDEDWIDNEDAPLGMRLFYAVKHPERKAAWLNFLFGDWNGDPNDMTSWKLVERYHPHHCRFKSTVGIPYEVLNLQERRSVIAQFEQYSPDLALKCLSFMDLRTVSLISTVNKWWHSTVRTFLSARKGRGINPVLYVISGLNQFHMASDEKITPLHVAAAYGNVDAIKAMIFSGYVELCFSRLDESYKLLTPIHKAAESRVNGAANAIRVLSFYGQKCSKNIQDHFDVNSKDINGRTPIHLALEYGRANSLRTLIQMGADPEILWEDPQTNDIISPLHLAVQRGRYLCTKVLLEEEVTIESRTLCAGIDSNDLKMVEMLLEAKCDPNIIGGVKLWESGEVVDRGCSVLSLCFGDLAIAETLLKNGANPNQPSTITGFTSLHACAYESKEDWMANRRLHEGEDWFWDEKVSSTGTMDGDIDAAFEEAQLTHIKLLLEYGVDCSLRDNNNRTALELYKKVRKLEGFKLNNNVVEELSAF